MHTCKPRGLLTCGVLNISYNKLPELPPSLGRMAALRSLMADHNALTGLPDMSGNGSLEKLEVMLLCSDQISRLRRVRYLTSDAGS